MIVASREIQRSHEQSLQGVTVVFRSQESSQKYEQTSNLLAQYGINVGVFGTGIQEEIYHQGGLLPHYIAAIKASRKIYDQAIEFPNSNNRLNYGTQLLSLANDVGIFVDGVAYTKPIKQASKFDVYANLLTLVSQEASLGGEDLYVTVSNGEACYNPLARKGVYSMIDRQMVVKRFRGPQLLYYVYGSEAEVLFPDSAKEVRAERDLVYSQFGVKGVKYSDEGQKVFNTNLGIRWDHPVLVSNVKSFGNIQDVRTVTDYIMMQQYLKGCPTEAVEVVKATLNFSKSKARPKSNAIELSGFAEEYLPEGSSWIEIYPHHPQ